MVELGCGVDRWVLLGIVSGRGQGGECLQSGPAGWGSGRGMPSACRKTWGDWRCGRERGRGSETRRPSAQRLGDGGGKLVKKERAPRHVNTPIEGASGAGGPRAGVSVAEERSADGGKGEGVVGSESRWGISPQTGQRSMSMPSRSRVQSAAVWGGESATAGAWNEEGMTIRAQA